VAPFDILRFNHYFFNFAADFVTLFYTKMAIFPTLLYTVSLNKAPLLGGASTYSPLQGVFSLGLKQRVFDPEKCMPEGLSRDCKYKVQVEVEYIIM